MISPNTSESLPFDYQGFMRQSRNWKHAFIRRACLSSGLRATFVKRGESRIVEFESRLTGEFEGCSTVDSADAWAKAFGSGERSMRRRILDAIREVQA